jgi:hypothetical protein
MAEIVLHEIEVDWEDIPYKVEVNEFAGYWEDWEIGPSERGYEPQRGRDPNITELKITVTAAYDDHAPPPDRPTLEAIHWKIWDDPHTWMDWI